MTKKRDQSNTDSNSLLTDVSSVMYHISMARTRKNHARYALVEKLRAQGKKFQEIADELGISRQRAWEIYSRIAATKTSDNLHDTYPRHASERVA